MPIPTGIENLSTTPASNNPAGSENVSEGDDHLRNLYAFLRQSFTAGADIASASTITPPSTGGSFNLTGTTTVTAIATTNSWSGRKIRFRHTGAHSFTQSTSLVCPGGVSITFANGDISEWAQNPSGGWEIVTYVPVLYISAPYFNATGSAVPANGMYLSAANTLTFSSASTLRGSVNATGNWVIAAPSSGDTVTITALATNSGLVVNLPVSSSLGGVIAQGASTDLGFRAKNTGTGGRDYVWLSTGGTSGLGQGNFVLFDNTASASRMTLTSAGNVTINAPASGVALTVSAVSGTHSTKIADSATNSFDAGFLVLPVSGSTTAALSDRGKGIVATGTITIPNATFAAGDVLAIYNNSGASITLTATITTMRLHGTATTGSRTLAQRGFASVYFVSGTECVVTGDVT